MTGLLRSGVHRVHRIDMAGMGSEPCAESHVQIAISRPVAQPGHLVECRGNREVHTVPWPRRVPFGIRATSTRRRGSLNAGRATHSSPAAEPPVGRRDDGVHPQRGRAALDAGDAMAMPVESALTPTLFRGVCGHVPESAVRRFGSTQIIRAGSLAAIVVGGRASQLEERSVDGNPQQRAKQTCRGIEMCRVAGQLLEDGH